MFIDRAYCICVFINDEKLIALMLIYVVVIYLQSTLALAPIKLVKLEFRLPEETFTEQVSVAEKTLQQEQRQLQKNENVKETLLKHRVS